jgi:histidinol dehydrogenase
VCIGAFTPSPAGSYVAGTNHVLPTGGAARHAAGLSVTHFVRRQSFERITRDGLERLRPSIATWSTYEGLPGHLAAIDARLRRVE